MFLEDPFSIFFMYTDFARFTVWNLFFGPFFFRNACYGGRLSAAFIEGQGGRSPPQASLTGFLFSFDSRIYLIESGGTRLCSLDPLNPVLHCDFGLLF